MMLLQIYFEVDESQQSAFEAMYRNVYVPALRKQRGYCRSSLLRLFPPPLAEEIGAASTPYNYQVELVFDTEENRRLWVASAEHLVVWPQAAALAQSVCHRAYHVAGDDSM